MTACEQFIKKIEKTLPEQCTVDDLVKAGIYKSPQAASHGRTSGDTPGYFKLGCRIIYPREAVIEWLKEKKHESNPHKHEKKISCLQQQARLA